MADNQSSILQSPNNVEPSLNVENILQEDDDSDVSDNYAGLFPNAEEKPEEIDDIYKQYGMEYKDILEGDKKKKRVAEDAHSFLNFADPSDFDNEQIFKKWSLQQNQLQPKLFTPIKSDGEEAQSQESHWLDKPTEAQIKLQKNKNLVDQIIKEIEEEEQIDSANLKNIFSSGSKFNQSFPQIAPSAMKQLELVDSEERKLLQSECYAEFNQNFEKEMVLKNHKQFIIQNIIYSKVEPITDIFYVQ